MTQSAATARPLPTEARSRADIRLPNQRYCADVVGSYDSHIILIEDRLSVAISARGTDLLIEGPPAAVAAAAQLLRDLYTKVECGETIDEGVIDGIIKMSRGAAEAAADQPVHTGNVIPQIAIRTRKKTIVPRTPAQANYMMALQRHLMTFGLGPAGTGKTYIAIAQAVAAMMAGEVEKLILTRPAVEAGEKIGFLPGTAKEKVDVYMRPLYDALHDCLPAEQVERKIESGEIEIAPVAFMRGRTLSNAFIILDEAQNATPGQMKMLLTRFGEGSRMVICGDPHQTDLPGGMAASGLTDAVNRLEGVDGIAMSRFGTGDVVRHPIVGRIVQAYEG